MTIQQLIYFREVAHELHFTKAAQNLFVTQAALSISISALEHELNVPLFVRVSSRAISLTEYGELLLPLAENAIKAFEHVSEEMTRSVKPMSGVINIAYSYLNGRRFVPKMFNSFSKQEEFAGITFRFFVEHFGNHFEEMVAQGKYDIAFSCTPVLNGLESVPIAEQELFCYMSKDNKLAKKEKVTIDDISNELLIGYENRRNLDKRINEMFANHGYKCSYHYYACDWTDQMTQVGIQDGVAILPLLPLNDDMITAKPIDDPLHTRHVYMMWNSKSYLSPAVKYVIDCCKNYYESLPIV